MWAVVKCWGAKWGGRQLLPLTLTLIAATSGGATAAEPGIAPTGTLRAAYIGSNPAQASKDPATGEIRGVSADMAREFGRRHGVPVMITPLASAGDVLLAVQSGEADIGFVAPNPERMGVVAYTQIYMRVLQSFLVRADSPIMSVADLDRSGHTVGANTGDSISLYMKMNFKQARVLESQDFTLKEAVKWLADGTVVAFGANRQRLGASTRGVQGIRMLADNLYGVPQAIALAKDRPELLAALNGAVNEWRRSGFLQQVMDRSGVEGISVAPAN